MDKRDKICKGEYRMEDQGIVRLYLQRSQQAIIETKNKYGAYCRVIARNTLSSYSDIEECENDTYLGAWNAIPLICLGSSLYF